MQHERHADTAITRHRRQAGFGLTAALLLGLAGCAATGSGGGVVYFTNFTAGYVPASVAAEMPLLVETFGSPGPNQAQQAVTAATVEGLRRHGPPWMPRGYTGSPADIERRSYVIRVAYGVPKGFNGQTLCTAEMSAQALAAAGGTADRDSGRTIAGVCRGTRAVAYGEGSPGSNADIGSARFAEFVGLLGRKLMPRRNPVTQDDCIFRLCD